MKGKRKNSQYLWVLTKAFLFAVVVFALAGCGMDSKQTDEMSQAENTSVPVVEMPETSTAPKQTEKAEKKEKKKKEEKKFDPLEITKGDLESNFDEAFKHVTICGKKVSFPLTLKKLGKDFSFKKDSYQPEDTDDLMGNLHYKGEKIADAWISNGKKDGDIKNRKIKFLVFRTLTSSVDYEIDICGVGFDSSKEAIFEIFGEPESEEKIAYHKNGKISSKRSIYLDFFTSSISIFYE